jgi:hypothetical protein
MAVIRCTDMETAIQKIPRAILRDGTTDVAVILAEGIADLGELPEGDPEATRILIRIRHILNESNPEQAHEQLRVAFADLLVS